MDDVVEVAGPGSREVIGALRARRERLRAGGAIDDGRKIALVVEGGSMRGVLSAGGMVALAKMGYADVFDHIYATSAAVMNASYFLSHQPDLGISVYFDACTTRNFWNPRRFWKMLDIDWLFDRVVAIDKPLDVARVMSHRTKLFVTLMDRRGVPHVVHVQGSKEPLLKLLKAAVAVPVFYNRCVDVEGKWCMDGGLIHGIPLEPALEAGCTDVLVLTTQAHGWEHRPPTWLSRQIFNVLCARADRALGRRFARVHERDQAVRGRLLGEGCGARMAVFFPPESRIPAWSFPSREVLVRGARAYEEMIARHFDEQTLRR